MELDDAELAELAAFLGRRLDLGLDHTPPPATPRQAVERADAWRVALHDARDRGTLSALLLRIARRHPNDANLQAAARLMTPSQRGANGAVIAVFLATGGGAALAAIGLLVALAIGGLHAAMVGAPTPDVSEPIALGGEGTLAPVRIERPIPSGRCTRPDGGQVGWWDAGPTSPGEAGDVLAIDGRHNVRAVHPSAENRWDTRSTIRCTLRPGDRVRLSGEPVLIPGGRWWVPLSTGDLLPEQSSALSAPSAHPG